MVQNARNFKTPNHCLPTHHRLHGPCKQKRMATVFMALQKVGYGKIAISAISFINCSRRLVYVRLNALNSMAMVLRLNFAYF